MFSYVNRQTFCMSFGITPWQSEKKCTWNCSKILVIFSFSVNFFMKTLIKSNLGMPDCVLGPFSYVCCKNCMSGFSAFVLNLSKSDNILFRKMPNGIYLFSSASLLLGGEITRWCTWTLSDGSWWATCKCNILRPISCTEISLWKRPISTVMPGKLFSSYVL